MPPTRPAAHLLHTPQAPALDLANQSPRSRSTAGAAMDGRDLRPLPPPPPPNPAMPYREDCWSEGATSALIDAWGDRYLELNRGNLRQKDWQEVADTVNSRRGGARRPSRTDSQCKNRIDTLKKKYKSEKARIMDSTGPSQWPFFPRLDVLIGNTPSTTTGIRKTPSPPLALALPLPSHRNNKATPLPAARAVELPRPTPSIRRAPTPPTALPVSDTFRRNYSAAAAAAAAAAEDSVSSASSSRERSPSPEAPVVRRWRADSGDGRDGVRQLAVAIERFAEVYEKVEEEKQQQMMELEMKRIEFMKGLEFQRMQAFVDSQVQLERVKRARRGDGGEQSSSAVLSCLLQPCFFTV